MTSSGHGRAGSWLEIDCERPHVVQREERHGGAEFPARSGWFPALTSVMAHRRAIGLDPRRAPMGNVCVGIFSKRGRAVRARSARAPA